MSNDLFFKYVETYAAYKRQSNLTKSISAKLSEIKKQILDQNADGVYVDPISGATLVVKNAGGVSNRYTNVLSDLQIYLQGEFIATAEKVLRDDEDDYTKAALVSDVVLNKLDMLMKQYVNQPTQTRGIEVVQPSSEDSSEPNPAI